MILKVGLTGGAGAGKSTVAELFKAKGVPVIDADQIVHQLLEPDELGYRAIVERWGDRFLDSKGRVDRKRLRELIFKSTDDRKWLEAQLHPEVIKQMATQAQQLDDPYCILVIPLLAESEAAQALVDRVLVVDARESQQIERLCARDHMDESAAKKIMDAQVERTKRLEIGDDFIENISSIEDLKAQVDALHRYYLAYTEGIKK